MDIKGFGVIHPRCLSNIVEIIHTEIEQNNIDNRNLEKFVISFLLSNFINDHHLRQSEKNKHHYIREKENSNINQIIHGIVESINKKEGGIISILGMVGTIIRDNHNHQI